MYLLCRANICCDSDSVMNVLYEYDFEQMIASYNDTCSY